jgi:single-stranded DNA-binding protein
MALNLYRAVKENSPSSNPSNNTTGISLLLDTVQVTKAVYRTDDDFEQKNMEIEGQPSNQPESSSDSDFKPVGNTKPDTFQSPSPNDNASDEASEAAKIPDFDDEIPF